MSFYVFQQQVSTAATELVAQQVQKFNAASGGALVMGDGDHIGDYIEQTSWQLIGGLAQRRNAYKDGEVNTQVLSQILDRMVKIDGRIGPVSVTPTMMKRLGKNVAEASAVVAAQSAEAMIQDYLNATASALVAAIQTNNEMVVDLSGAAGKPVAPSLRGLNKGARPMGDAYSRLIAWLMDGATYNDFTDESLTNATNLFNIGNVNIMQDGMGRRFVVSDIPALASGDLQYVLGLTAGAAAVKTTPLIMKAQDVLGNENLKALMQGEYDFTVGLKGYAWADATVKSPTDAQLSGANAWEKITTSNKDTAGVLVTFGAKTDVKVTEVTLDPTSLSVAVGKTSSIKATVAPGNASNKAITWASADAATVTVDSSGTVKGIAAGGPVNITATAADGSGIVATCAVSVTAASK